MYLTISLSHNRNLFVYYNKPKDHLQSYIFCFLFQNFSSNLYKIPFCGCWQVLQLKHNAISFLEHEQMFTQLHNMVLHIEYPKKMQALLLNLCSWVVMHYHPWTTLRYHKLSHPCSGRSSSTWLYQLSQDIWKPHGWC